MSRLTKFLVSAGILTAIAVAVGFLVSTGERFDWGLTLLLVGIAISGEGLRTWIRWGRADATKGPESETGPVRSLV